jgi:hypothetical protein
MHTDIFSILRGQLLTSGGPFPGLTNAAPLPASEIRLVRMQFASVNNLRVNMNGYESTQVVSGNAGSNSGTMKLH